MLKYDHGTFYTHRICGGYKLLLTVCKVLRREGIGSADGATKEPFEGTETNMQNKEIR